ncbi:MAG TPA: hypothetical protein VHQ86_05735 [Candidatus Saccharimonadia bacterium]|jgi:hypothetical protein|nr:hypothetical protein [Candidatus Saccharimonadia bacterium]
MKFLSHVLAFILATVLAASVSTWILSHTLWNAKFLEQQATQAQLYPKLATAIPASAAASDPSVAKSGVTSIDPALIENQVNTLLPPILDHIRKGTPAPTVNLVDLAAAIGQDPPENGPTTQTIDFGSADTKVTQYGHDVDLVGTYAPWVALGLIILIVAVMRHHRWPTLSRAAFDTAIGMALLAGLFMIIPQLVLQALNKAEMKAVHDAVSPFASQLFNGLAARFGLAALVFLLAAIGLWCIYGISLIKAKFAPKSKKPKAPTAAPGSAS